MLTKLIYVLGLLITLINTDVDADSLTTAQADFQAELTVSELEAEAEFMEDYKNDYGIETNLAWFNENQCIILMSQTIDDRIVYGISILELEETEDGIDVYDSETVYVYDNRIIFEYDYDHDEIYGDILVER
jgi:hypothetical protein